MVQGEKAGVTIPAIPTIWEVTVTSPGGGTINWVRRARGEAGFGTWPPTVASRSAGLSFTTASFSQAG